VTTASIRGNLRGTRGRAKGKKKATEDGGSKPARGRGRGSSNRKVAEDGGSKPARPSTPVEEHAEESQPEAESMRISTYPTGPGSAHWWFVVGMTSGACQGPCYLPAGVPGISTALG
jgi:hypothetical protein